MADVQGTDTAIWLDGLDQPIFEDTFQVRTRSRSRADRQGANFMDRLPERPDANGQRYHDSSVDTSDEPTRYPWADMLARLDAVAGPYAMCEYLNERMPSQHISRTIAAYAERIAAGAQSPARQDTCNRVRRLLDTILTPSDLPLRQRLRPDGGHPHWPRSVRRRRRHDDAQVDCRRHLCRASDALPPC